MNLLLHFLLINVLWTVVDRSVLVTSSARTIPEDYVVEANDDEGVLNDDRDQLFSNRAGDKEIPFTFSNFKKTLLQQHHLYPTSPSNSHPFLAQPLASSYAPQQQKPKFFRPPPQPVATMESEMVLSREVAIKQGRVKGVVRSMYTQSGLRDVNQYLGLPYAESPVGNKRFMPPGKTFTIYSERRRVTKIL